MLIERGFYSCGCKTEKEHPHLCYGDTVIKETGTCSYPCFECRQVMIGTRQLVVRYGNIPKSGLSYNHRDNHNEVGVSVYTPTMRPRSEFIDRPKLEFTAIVVGFGSDDEPLIDATTIS